MLGSVANKRDPREVISLPCVWTRQEGGCRHIKRRVLTRNWTGQQLELRLLPNCEQ